MGDVGLLDPVGGRSGSYLQQLRPSDGSVLRPVEAHVVLDRGQVRPVALDGVEVVARVDEDTRAGVVDVVVERVRVLQVDQCGDGTQTPGTEHGGEVVQTVVREDPDAVAAFDAEGRQPGGDTVHGLHGFGVAESPRPLDPVQRTPFRGPVRPIDEHVEDAQARSLPISPHIHCRAA